jgi:hypothetical protein
VNRVWCFVAFVCAASAGRALAQDSDPTLGEAAPSVRIENHSSQEFRFLVHRSWGPYWTRWQTLQPAGSTRFGPVFPDQPTEFAMLVERYSPGRLVVAFPLYDGLRLQRLNPSKVYWFLVDHNGRGGLYEQPEPPGPRDVDHADYLADPSGWLVGQRQRVQARLDRVPSETPQSAAERVRVLTANHAFRPFPSFVFSD